LNRLCSYKTLQAAGFFVNYYTPAEATESTQDIFFLASLQKQDYRQLKGHLRYNDWHRTQTFGYTDLIREDEPLLDDAVLLTDDKPKLELLNAASILQWRQNKVAQNMRPMIQSGMDIYQSP
jgi:hypothetical protein